MSNTINQSIMKKILQILLVTLLLACENSSKNERYDYNSNGFFLQKSVLENPEELEETVVVGYGAKKETLSTPKKLIKNGTISFETDDLVKTKASIAHSIQKVNGYISSENQNNYGDRKTINLSVRIPAQYFDSILSQISKNVVKFDTKNIQISDVTEEFLDVESRLKNKKQLEIKYLDILKRANSVQEILEVEKELGKIREEIESTEGRLKYLENQVAFSTLNISFYKIEESESTSFVKRVSNGFSNGFENLKSFFIGLLQIWPFIIVFVVIVFWLKKRVLKRKSK